MNDGKFKHTRFYKRFVTLVEAGKMRGQQLKRLEVAYDGLGQPTVVWRDTPKRVEVLCISPIAYENLEAASSDAPNDTSAVVVVVTGDARVILSADSHINQWKTIQEEHGQKLTCKILAVSHHGGLCFDKVQHLTWLYEHAIDPELAIVSVGTNNPHDHPRDDVLNELRKNEIKIMCTQITKKCTTDLEAVRPGVLTPTYPGLSSTDSDFAKHSGKSQNVACAGTIKAIVGNGMITAERVREHTESVAKLGSRAHGYPKCIHDAPAH